jgi:hypothetical protein
VPSSSSIGSNASPPVVETSLVITERYRCPGQIVTTGLAGQPGAESGYFRFGNDVLCYGRPCSGHPVLHPDGAMPDLLGSAITEGGKLLLPFDLTQIVNNLRYERYSRPCNGGSLVAGWDALASKLYYAVRSLLPIAVRRHLQALYLRGWEKIPFPRWPVDVTVETLLEAVLMLLLKVQEIDAIPFIWFWPDGAGSATIMTHDIETAAGRDRCSLLMDVDESFGLRSAFQIVPEGRYALPSALLEEIRSRGHEINIQDLNHDGRLFHDRSEFEIRVKRINQYGRDLGARGFRSAVLYRNLDWYDRFDFEYDMSVPNAGHLEAQRGGCCTVFPFFIGNILELPVTTTQDYSLFHILRDYTPDVWTAQANAVLSKHGLLSFIVHPDYLKETRAQDLYRRLLAFLNQRRIADHTWIATPGEVNTWWRQRSKLRLVGKSGAWKIEGSGKERARIAYARLDGDRIVYTLKLSD